LGENFTVNFSDYLPSDVWFQEIASYGVAYAFKIDSFYNAFKASVFRYNLEVSGFIFAVTASLEVYPVTAILHG